MTSTTLAKRIKIQNQLAKAEQDRMKFRKKAINKAFNELGSIDKKHEAGKITKKQHDQKSKKALEKLVKRVR